MGEPDSYTMQLRTMPVITGSAPDYIRTSASRTNGHWRNLVVLMFSHYVNHLECTGSLKGHRTLMVHECLVVAAVLGWYHHWQCRVSHQDRDTYDWTKVPVVPKDDFRHKYSPALALLGNAQNLGYAHPKLLRHCFDNVYFCWRIIGDLPARGKLPHSEERTKLIYNQEYEELVHRLQNTLDLTLESPSYSMVPTSLVNPDIVLPHQEFGSAMDFWNCHRAADPSKENTPWMERGIGRS